jgi:dTDP-4-amino-4,6-dideoxygalactose transaminase/RimJ/RimL family protein N-acetyltransferase
VGNREARYVNDAALHGWNLQWNKYLELFESSFLEYIGSSYGLTTSSCTGAMHLALLAMGIGRGDEVIVPETTWIATASAVVYVGATPVFADIDPDTWVLNVEEIEKKITNRTKAVIPVHLYGNPVDMDLLLALREKYGFYILEDAAPSIGTEYKGSRTGSFGDMAAFSFQGAKAFVTGEGGFLVSSNKRLIDNARVYWDHGRDPENPLSAKTIGYKYKMSNIQAALGLAQIEKASEIVEKKREIYRWYHDRLKDVEVLTLNIEKEWARSTYWMTSAIVEENASIHRDTLMARLKERNVDTRPIFAPISSFPMFDSCEMTNPVAFDVPMRGLNLPSGHNLREEEVDYICSHIRELLGYNLNRTRSEIWGWLGYRDNIIRRIRDIKQESSELELRTESGIRLVPVTSSMKGDSELISRIAEWRRSAQYAFPTQFEVTEPGTSKWLDKLIDETEDRLLFLLHDGEQYFGHIGLFRFNYHKRRCEIDNIVRGIENIHPGAMETSIRTMMKWARESLGVVDLYLKVFSDNERALNLYKKLGFVEVHRQGLHRISENGVVEWVPQLADTYDEIYKYFVTMKLIDGK